MYFEKVLKISTAQQKTFLICIDWLCVRYTSYLSSFSSYSDARLT